MSSPSPSFPKEVPGQTVPERVWCSFHRHWHGPHRASLLAHCSDHWSDIQTVAVGASTREDEASEGSRLINLCPSRRVTPAATCPISNAQRVVQIIEQGRSVSGDLPHTGRLICEAFGIDPKARWGT